MHGRIKETARANNFDFLHHTGWIINYSYVIIGYITLVTYSNVILQFENSSKMFKDCKSEYFIDRNSSSDFVGYFSQCT